jgi:antitoxin CptB
MLAQPLARERLERLKWKCRRGLLELDIVLGRYLAARNGCFAAEEIAALEDLLDSPDNDLWDVVAGRSEPAHARHRAVVDALRAI